MLYTNGTALPQPGHLINPRQPGFKAPIRSRQAFTQSNWILPPDLSPVDGSKVALKLIMQANGTDVVGKFSLDSSAPRYKIIGLQLAEIDNASKNANTQGNGAGAGTGTGAGAGGTGTTGRRRKQ